MKKKLNILCAIVLLVLGWQVVETSYYFVLGAAKGMKVGYEYAKQLEENPQAANRAKIDRLQGITNIHVLPRVFKEFDLQDWMADSVYNAKTGQYVPAMYYKMMVSVEKPHNTVYSAVNFLLSMLIIAANIWALVLFIKWILAVNRSDIFNWHNVRRLRLMGGLLLLSTACSVLTEYLSIRNLEQVFAMNDYELNLSGSISHSILLLGLCSLIVAEVFAIGLRMKDEQELTI